MKSVLISIQPKWCKLIAKGKKTVEVRKTAPKEVPFKAYIYMTKAKPYWFRFVGNGIMEARNGKVIGEFICNKIECIEENIIYNAKVLCKESCLSIQEISDYTKGKKFYAFHISDLKIYDEPRELSEFSRFGFKYCGGCCINYCCINYIDNGYYEPPECKIDGCVITRPPQSWQYIEEQ